MSQVSPHKEHFVAPAKIQEIRNRWSANVASASVVVIVGASHNANDTHVLDAIRKTTAKILYIGGITEADKWRETNSRVEHIGERFEQGFDELLRRLGCSRRDRFGRIGLLWIASLILPVALFVLLPDNVAVFTHDTRIILAKLHLILVLWTILTVMLCVITWRWFQRHNSER